MVDSFKAFVDKWHTPALYTVLLGGIIWGVQLNFAVLELTKQMAAQQQDLKDTKDEVHSMAVLIAQTVAELKAVSRYHDALERRMTRNESWIDENKHHTHPRNQAGG